MGTRWTRLTIGAETSVVSIGEDAVTLSSVDIELGASSTAAKYFRHDPPTPLEWETAIQVVEDALDPVRALGAGGELLGDGFALSAVLQQAGATTSIAMVEKRFQLLATARLPLPDGLESAATLLILREFLHHIEFDSIRLVG